MSITEELRDFVGKISDFGSDNVRELADIADRIDREYDADTNRAWRNGFDAGVHSTLMWDDDTWLEGHGLVRLPVDEDGKVWHVGDEIATTVLDDTDRDTPYPGKEKVRGLALTESGWRLGVCGVYIPVEQCSRHKPTPAERIREWVERFYEYSVAPLANESRSELLAIADELEGETE